MRTLKTFLAVVGAVTVLVLAANTVAYAATGGKFILGRTNKANTVSTLKRTTPGPTLNLVTKSSSNAPMTVNGSGKVVNLNADTIDGADSSAFAPSSLSGQVSGIALNTPIAVGFINADGTIAHARGVDASTWDAANNRYQITLTGVSYYFSNFATVVTSSCNDTTARVLSGSGHLQVYLQASGVAGQCSFQFATYKLS